MTKSCAYSAARRYPADVGGALAAPRSVTGNRRRGAQQRFRSVPGRRAAEVSGGPIGAQRSAMAAMAASIAWEGPSGVWGARNTSRWTPASDELCGLPGTHPAAGREGDLKLAEPGGLLDLICGGAKARERGGSAGGCGAVRVPAVSARDRPAIRRALRPPATSGIGCWNGRGRASMPAMPAKRPWYFGVLVVSARGLRLRHVHPVLGAAARQVEAVLRAGHRRYASAGGPIGARRRHWRPAVVYTVDNHLHALQADG